jgi:hypothetical protein
LVATSLLLFVVGMIVVAAALGLCAGIGLAPLLHHLGDWGVPGMALCSPGALVCQAKERRDILYVMGGELLQHLLIPHSLVKCIHNRSIRDTKNGIVNLGEPLDEGAQGFPRALLDSVGIGLVARPSIGTLEVGRELAARL